MADGAVDPLFPLPRYRGLAIDRPLDALWSVQELIAARGIDWVVELGTGHGGSALFLADVLAGNGRRGAVISIDPAPPATPALARHKHLGLVAGDPSAPAVAGAAHARVDGPALLLLRDRPEAAAALAAHAPHLKPGDLVAVEGAISAQLAAVLAPAGLAADTPEVARATLRLYVKRDRAATTTPAASDPDSERREILRLARPRPFAFAGADEAHLQNLEALVARRGAAGAAAEIGALQARSATLFVDVAVGPDGRPAAPEVADAAAVARLLAAPGLHRTVDCLGVVSGTPSRMIFRSRAVALRPLHALSPAFLVALEAFARDAKPTAATEAARHDTVVWRVPLEAGRFAALKMVEARDPETRMLLFREHEMLRALAHPLVPRAQGWAIERGRYYLLTDWIEGVALAGNVDALRADLADAAARVAFTDALRGLGRALELAGIEHRDISEENVVLRGVDPVLVNFGAARWRDETGAPALAPPPAANDAAAIEALIERVLD